MKLIPLTKNQFAQVDDADYEWLSQYSWHAYWNKNTKSYYARRSENLGKVDGKYKYKTVYMHREILGLENGDPRIGDHKQPAETLNNQRSNLRIANTDFESARNRRIFSNHSTGFKGVDLRPNGKYRAKIYKDGKLKHLGTRDTPEAAHALYVEAAQEAFGEFARAA